MARILVVEDETNIRTMYRLGLSKDGHEVLLAAHGLEALELISQEDLKLDCFMLDLRMPLMDGYEVLRRIRSIQKWSRTPVIISTAFGGHDIIRELQPRTVFFLKKPFLFERACFMVRRVLATCANTEHHDDVADSALKVDKIVSGFTIFAECTTAHDPSNGTTFYINVEGPYGELEQVAISIPAYVLELIEAYLDVEISPQMCDIWIELARAELENYLWQNASLPPSNLLHVDDLSRSMQRWLDQNVVGCS